MFRKVLREFFMLSRGEQRAMMLVSLLLVLSLGARITVQLLPARKPSGVEALLKESRRIMVALAEADSIKNKQEQPTGSRAFVPNTHSKKSLAVIPINSADSADLLPLPGIGPVFAGRIIKYRNMLGGFVSISQLSEVYGLSPETILQIKPYVQIDTLLVRKLLINTASFREILKHPYLEYVDVQAIMNYLDLAGALNSIQDLRQNMVLADSTLEKVRCYLDFSE